MPVVDMSVEKLFKFEGVNPCPADIEEYWDRAIAEMEALGTGCELVPAAFQAPNVECYEMYFIGVGGAKVHCRLAKPKNIEGKSLRSACSTAIPAAAALSRACSSGVLRACWR